MNSRPLLSNLLVLIASTFLLFSCKKDIDTQDPGTNPPGNVLPVPASTPVSGSLRGQVVNENNQPMSGATVNLGSAVTTTDATGIFSFQDVTMDKYVTTVTVNMAGYYKGIRSFSASASENYVSIKMIPKSLSGTFSAAGAGSVSLSNGTELTFQPNSVVVKSTGAAYTGTVNVYSTYIDPTAADIGTRVPGSFMGRDGNNMYSLQSTGMLAVEMESAAGVPLQLASSMPATIKLPIPASLASKAPATINTWSLNDQGVWVKEGTATKSGNLYEFQASHFSFWNCDVPANAVYLTLHLQDQNGNPLPNTMVSLTVPNNNTWWATTYGLTDGQGNVSGMVPAGLSLEMEVLPNPYTCNTPVYTQTIGPFNTNASLTITVTLTAAQQLTITGTAVDCNGQPLQSGMAMIYNGTYNYLYVPVVNGSYTATTTQCSATSSINVTIVDTTNGASGNSGAVAVSGNTVTVPAITVCGTQNAVFVLGCQPITWAGNYYVGVALDGSNAIVMMADVVTPGAYTITTNTAGGMTFSASGVFTQIGQQTVVLQGVGIPTAIGTYTFDIQSSGAPTCVFTIIVNNPPPPPASIDLGTGSCSGVSVNGTYSTGIWLNTNNNVTLTVNVLNAGTYYISTNNINGLAFSDSGTFTSTGVQTIVLFGSGSPQTAGTFVYNLQANGATGCSFAVTVTAPPLADYTFGGAPGACASATVSGSYTAGVPLLGQNGVSFMVDVMNTGSYEIITNTDNGYTFSGSGFFSTTGPRMVFLQATGTPVNAATTSTFVLEAVGLTAVQGCNFQVTTN